MKKIGILTTRKLRLFICHPLLKSPLCLCSYYQYKTKKSYHKRTSDILHKKRGQLPLSLTNNISWYYKNTEILFNYWFKSRKIKNKLCCREEVQFSAT